MEKSISAVRALACMLFAIFVSMGLAGTASAAGTVSVSGADYYVSGANVEDRGAVDVLQVRDSGDGGSMVFVSVKLNGKQIAKNIPSKANGHATGVITLDFGSLDEADLDGRLEITACDSRAKDARVLYTGKVYAVHAQLDDKGKTEVLLGTRTLSGDENRRFSVPDTLYKNGKTYKPADKGVLADGYVSGSGSIDVAYASYDEGATADARITYVDAQTGELVNTKVIAGLEHGDLVTQTIPALVLDSKGNRYRTLNYGSTTVTLENPGALTCTVPCTKVSDAQTGVDAPAFSTKVNMTDEDGNVIATDTVTVKGSYVYTPPSKIYRTRTVDAQAKRNAVVTYELDGPASIELNSINPDGTTAEPVKTVQVRYMEIPLEQPSVEVTFNLHDGTKRLGEKGRVIKAVTKTVDARTPLAVPPKTVQVDGDTYTIVGKPSEYAYRLGAGIAPSVDVYYVPEGYRAEVPYEVALRYINYADGKVITTESYTSSPNATAAVSLKTPESFSLGGKDWVRLPGQEDIKHSYYSGIDAYAVYYRDKSEDLNDEAAVTRIRTVYTDAASQTSTTGATSATGARTANTSSSASSASAAAAAPSASSPNASSQSAASAGSQPAASSGSADQGSAASSDAASASSSASAPSSAASPDVRLDQGRTYNTTEGQDGSANLADESGASPDEERIDDLENALSSGDETQQAPEEGPNAGLIAAIVAVLAALGAGAAIIVRRRKGARDEYGEQDDWA